MPDTKITALTAIGANPIIPSTFPIPMVDLTDTSMAASGTTKKVTVNQILGAGGTATLASATITGDLGVGTASPSTKLEVATATANTRLRINSTSVVATEYFRSGTGLWLVGSDSTNAFKIARGSNFGGSADYFSIGSATADCTWFDTAGGTRMTLNATGLGVGVIPSGTTGNSKISVVGGVTYDGNFDIIGNFTSSATASAAKGVLLGYNNSTNNGIISAAYGGGTEGLTFWTHNGSSWGQRMELTATGNVGIGVTPSAWVSTVKALDISSGGAVYAGSLNCGLAANYYLNSSGNYIYKTTAFAAGYIPNYANNGSHVWFNAPSGTAGNAITFTQAMTLDASGNLLVGVTAAPSGTIGGSGFIADSNSRKQLHLATTASASQVLAVFINPNGTVGTIETNGSSTAYNISSDYRLKEEVKPLTGALNRITALKPSTYKWKVDGSVGEGFIAHELAEVVPFAVSGQKDAVNADGSMKTQGVDLSKIIPILVAAVQELTARVQTLETR